MSKTAIFMVSKNNYDFMAKHWIPHMHMDGYEVLNIDEESSDEQREYGKGLCREHGIVFLDRDKTGLQNNMALARSYFKDKGIEYLLWFQHDCWPIDSSFIDKFNSLVEGGKLKEFGVVGFNGLATDVVQNFKEDIKKYKKGKKPLGILARSPLEGRAWYVFKGKDALPKRDGFLRPFAIESVAWFAIALNLEQFDHHIEVDGNYGFHLAWDDIAFQFLKNNVYNVALPKFYVAHRPDLKPELGMPKCSAKYTRNSENTYYYTQADHLNVWKEKWGFDWQNKKSFRGVLDRYRGTLLESFYNHDPATGPLKNFDLS